jgi:hypothetical protein
LNLSNENRNLVKYPQRAKLVGVRHCLWPDGGAFGGWPGFDRATTPDGKWDGVSYVY